MLIVLLIRIIERKTQRKSWLVVLQHHKNYNTKNYIVLVILRGSKS